MMKQAIILILIGIMLTSITTAAEVQNTQTTNLQEIEYKTLMLEQHAKTQASIKQELSKRDAEIEKKIEAFVDANFAILDERINDFIKKGTFKLGMAFFSAIVLGGSILLLINNQLRRKRAIKKHSKTTNEELVLSGSTLQKVKEQTQTNQEEDEEPTPEEEKLLKERLEQLKKQITKEKNQIPKKTVLTPTKTNTTTMKDQTIKPLGEQ